MTCLFDKHSWWFEDKTDRFNSRHRVSELTLRTVYAHITIVV